MIQNAQREDGEDAPPQPEQPRPLKRKAADGFDSSLSPMPEEDEDAPLFEEVEDTTVRQAQGVSEPEYRKPTHRGARTTVFILLGLCGAVPSMHGLALHGIRTMCVDLGLGWLLLSAACYITGALL